MHRFKRRHGQDRIGDEEARRREPEGERLSALRLPDNHQVFATFVQRARVVGRKEEDIGRVIENSSVVPGFHDLDIAPTPAS